MLVALGLLLLQERLGRLGERQQRSTCLFSCVEPGAALQLPASCESSEAGV